MKARAPGDFIEAYKAAQSRVESAELREFLPSREDPLYLAVLRGLVCIDLECSWKRGRPISLDEYERRFPELFADHTAVREIAFADYCCRWQAGERPSQAEYQRRYHIGVADWPTIALPNSAGPCQEVNDFLAARAEHHQLLPESSSGADFTSESPRSVALSNAEMTLLLAQPLSGPPQPGSCFLAFQLLAELGRGAFGRVFLARQGDLANRLVALKISVGQFQELQTLAQLQHTNIVPVYSVHQASPLQAVCMPYFGAATLGDVLQDLERLGSAPKSGKFLVETVRARQGRLSSKMNASGIGNGECPPRVSSISADTTRLGALSYVEAILWIAAQVADGLAHAHERGILHRDLKPANILLTDHGQPMVVDFNLSADTKRHPDAAAAHLGGTLPYMAPEHLEAFQSGARPVDARSDLYSLGVVLFHLLAGRLPFAVPTGSLKEILPLMTAERRQGSPLLRCWNKAVTPAAEAILRRLLQPEPEQRYQSAKELHEDLQRQLDSLPLRHAAEPSLRERAHKWARRHPRLMSPASLGGILAALLVALAAAVVWSMYREEQEKAKEQEGQVIEARSELKEVHGEAEALKRKAEASLGRFQKALVSHRQREGDLRNVRRQFDTGPIEREDSAEDVQRCRAVLNEFKVLDSPAWQEAEEFRHLPPSEQSQLRSDVGELLYLLARTLLYQVPPPRDRGPLFEALV